MQGIILKAISGFYYVKSGDTITECKARGIFKNDGTTVLPGDIAEFTELPGNKGCIERILPRKNSLSRPPIANIDKMFIVSSYSIPNPNYLIIDTLTAICEHNGIEPVLVFNKSDMGNFDEYVSCYNKVGYKVIVTSAQNGDGIDALKKEICGCVSVFTGNSGVGKSSLLNLILPGANLKTGEVSKKLGRGRHTTRHIELFPCSDGYVADTPGFSDIEANKNDISFKENLPYCFKEFENFLPNCKFTGCSHTVEKGCAVINAVSDGEIPKTRLESYKLIYNSLKDIKQWQIDKKRK